VFSTIKNKLAVLATSTAAALCLTAGLSASAQDRLIVFGDSLSDGGFFATVNPALSPDAASFTTNPDPVAPEVFASNIGQQLAVAYGPGATTGTFVTTNGTNYAIGGARVTLPNASGVVPLSVTEQIDLFMASGRTFTSNDVVYIQGGGNDFFAFQAGGGTDLTILTAAATDLAAQVARLQATGVKNIVTMSVQTGGPSALLQFNDTYKQALVANGANVLFFDNDALFNEIIFDVAVRGGATFGITNITGVACASGSSLGCDPSQYVTPNANRTFALADAVHPAGITQEIQGQAIASVFNAGEQVGQMAYGAIALFRSQAEIAVPGGAPSASADNVATFLPGGKDGNTTAYIATGLHGFENDTGRGDDIDQSGFTIAAGLDYSFSPDLFAGIALAYSNGDGDFGTGGGYDFDAYSATLHLRGTAQTAMPLHYNASATYGRVDFDDIVRSVTLGPSVRHHHGDTEADYFAVRGGVELEATTLGNFAIGPEAQLLYERVDIDAFTTNAASAFPGPLSTNVAFGSTDFDQVTGRVGVFAKGTVEAIEFTGRVSWNHAFGDDGVSVTTTSTGAPVAFTRDVGNVDSDYVSFEFTASGQISERARLTAGIAGDLFRDDQTRLSGKIGVDISF